MCTFLLSLRTSSYHSGLTQLESGADIEREGLLLCWSSEVTTNRVRRDEGRKKDRYEEKSERQGDIMKQQERKRARNEHNKKGNCSVSSIRF